MTSSLTLIATQLTRVVYPIIVVVGLISNSLNAIVLRRPNLRNQSCALYFLALSINNLVYISTGIIYNVLVDCFGIDLMSYSNSLCKFIWFLLDFFPHVSLYMLILASIDRYFCSSLSVRMRQFSNLRTAAYSIVAAVIFAVLFVIGTALIVDLSLGPNPTCRSHSNSLLYKIIATAQSTVYVFVGPFFMALFGLLTIHNVNQLKNNNIAAVHYRPTQRQLTRMLIVQISARFILSSPFCALFILLVTPTTFIYTNLYSFLFTITKIPFYTDFITPFFLYILTAKLYRHELATLIRKIFRKNQNITIHPIGI